MENAHVSFREAARGLPVNRVQRMLEEYLPGISFSGCGKELMAESFAERVERGGALWAPDLLQRLRDAPRETAESRRAKKQKRVAEAAVLRLEGMLENALSDEELDLSLEAVAASEHAEALLEELDLQIVKAVVSVKAARRRYEKLTVRRALVQRELRRKG